MIITTITTVAVGFILYSLKNNLSIFLTPKQVIAEHIAIDKTFRLGGLVKAHSVQRDMQSLNTRFLVTDNHNEILVRYSGVLPDLFREGSGVIAEGKLNAQHEFIATMVLAKHDETYMPKNVYKAIRENAA
jgi:cytochrome c-type biogenesis protein CcmE